MKALALALCVALGAAGARDSDPVYDAPDKAPDVYGPLVWRSGGVDTHGYFFTDRQTQAIDLRIKYLEDRAAKECTDATQAANRQWLGGSPSTWIGIGLALVVGAAGGFYAAKHF